MNYGSRMNYSVFECFITHFQFNEVFELLNLTINKQEDSILIYQLDKISALQSIYIGTNNFPRLRLSLCNYQYVVEL